MACDLLASSWDPAVTAPRFYSESHSPLREPTDPAQQQFRQHRRIWRRRLVFQWCVLAYESLEIH